MITLILVAANVILSMIAFQNRAWLDKLLMWPYMMRRPLDYYRFISSGFVHADLMHLAFNMLALYSFGMLLEDVFNQLLGSEGIYLYILFYLSSIAIASIPDFFLQRNKYEYRALGASGGVSAVVFACILIFPTGTISFFFIPMPAILFGILYLVYSAYMARKQMDNVGHLAHFTGAVYGLIFMMVLHPPFIGRFAQQIADYIRF